MTQRVRSGNHVDIAAFVPHFLRQQLAREGAAGGPGAETVSAAVMLADLSGFSALAERFGRQGTRGVEELKELLNGLFGPLVDDVHDHGGHVLKFPGDAVLAFWPAIDNDVSTAALLAAHCGLAAHEKVRNIRTPDGAQLHLRVGLGVGTVWTAVVGGTAGRLELLVAGEGLGRAVRALGAAAPGEVVGSSEMRKYIARHARASPRDDGHVRIDSVDVDAATPRDVLLAAECPEPLLRPYVPRAIQAKLDAGHTDWLAEFRRVTVLFVNIVGIDFTAADPRGPLQRAFSAVQAAVYRYDGSINQLLVDDKGTVVACGWGLPLHAHDDDAMRAVRAAFDIRNALRDMGLESSCGIATGDVFTGLRGNDTRCEYAMIGDTVNRAARLMQIAGDRHVLCDAASFERASDRVEFEALPPVRVKGFERPIAVYRPVRLATIGPSQIIGRVAERQLLRDRLEALVSGRRPGAVILEGDAGIGKSRLVADVIDAAVSQGVRTLLAGGDEIERSAPYHAWRPLFENLLGLRRASVMEANQRVVDLVQSDARLLPFTALLNPVLSLNVVETKVAERVPPRGRAILTRDLLLHLFRRAIREQPTLLVLEDAHWFDSASWALVEAIVRASASVFPLLVMRPVTLTERPPELVRLSAAEGVLAVRLDGLDPEETRSLVCQQLRVRDLDEPLAHVIREKADGHPFFTEELVHALRDRGLLEVEHGMCRFASHATAQSLQIPDTVQVAVTSRVDQLSVAEQLTVKVASVLGTTFELDALRSAYPIDIDAVNLRTQLDALVDRDLFRRTAPEPPVTYAFKHAITQDVAYSLLPYGQRRQLHARIAEWYEHRHSENLAAVSSLLAHHWSRADVAERAIFYLEKAGEQAVGRHANQEVARFYAEAIAIDRRAEDRPEPHRPIQIGRGRFVGAHTAQRIRWHRRLGDAQINLGKWDEGRKQFERALTLIGRPLPGSSAMWAAGLGVQTFVQCARRIGPRLFGQLSPEAIELLREAVGAYARVGANAYQYDRLVQVSYCLIASINLAERLGPTAEFAVACSDMGNILGLVPLRPLARTYHRLATTTANQLGDPVMTARVRARASVFQLALGNWSEACTDLDLSMTLCDQIGDSYVWEENATFRSLAALLTADFELAARLGAEIRRRAAAAGSLGHEIWGFVAEVWGTLNLGLHSAALDLAERGLRLVATAERTDSGARVALLAAKALAHVSRAEFDPAREAVDASVGVLAKSAERRYFAVIYLSGVVETCLALWEAAPGDRAMDAQVRVSRLCRMIDQYARISPPGRARAWLWRGCMDWLGGRFEPAQRAWRRALVEADRFSLPYETARAHYEIGRRLAPTDPERIRHLLQAEEGFRRVKAEADLNRVKAFGITKAVVI